MSDAALIRIANALERMSPAPLEAPDFAEAEAFLWHTSPDQLEPIANVSRVDLDLLVGIDRSRDVLLENTLRFAQGMSANNALLWGARGMGKILSGQSGACADQCARPAVKSGRAATRRFAVGSRAFWPCCAARPIAFYCFVMIYPFPMMTSIISLSKLFWMGASRGVRDNVIFYATSNRRHLMPRDMIENERSSAINPGEAVEEKVSLSDRFGLWLGFHPCDQDQYLSMIEGYCAAHGVAVDPEVLRAEAIEWQATRGSRSGRVAWQFFVDLAGRHGVVV